MRNNWKATIENSIDTLRGVGMQQTRVGVLVQ